MQTTSLTRSSEDYLKNIYHLQRSGKKINTGNLASLLGVSAASVSEMISKLAKKKWLVNTPYYGFKLTREGEKLAVNLTRKHRMIEAFLYKNLNYKWDEVHPEAEKLEHVCSDKFIDKLEKYLGYPKFDPHGDPIPDRYGKTEKVEHVSLSEAGIGTEYIITKVNDESNEVLNYLTNIGLKLRSKITVHQKIEFDGSVLVLHRGRKQLLSGKMSESIFLTKS
jgi:DtxR family Mn-dependent transcriptional regulator